MNEDCPICLEKVSEADSKTSCGHSFHEQCLTTWFMTSNTCPMCRTKLEESNEDALKIRNASDETEYNNRIMVRNQELEAISYEIQRRINNRLYFEQFVTKYNESFDRLPAENIFQRIRLFFEKYF